MQSKKGYYILIGMSVFFSLFFVIGFLLPSTFSVQRSITIQVHHSQIYPYLEQLDTWQNWTAWSKSKDPTLVFTFSEKTSGEGASQSWKGETFGTGSLTLTECVPEEGVRYKMNLQDRLAMNGRIHFADTSATHTQVVWSKKGDLGGNPIFRYFGLLIGGMVAPDLEEGLGNLKGEVE